MSYITTIPFGPAVFTLVNGVGSGSGIPLPALGSSAEPLTEVEPDFSGLYEAAGEVRKMYHQAASFVPPSTWVLIGSGAYEAGVLNIIYFEKVGARVEYWVAQEEE